MRRLARIALMATALMPGLAVRGWAQEAAVTAPAPAATPAAPPAGAPVDTLARLTADRVDVVGRDLLIAAGGVEVSYRGAVLRAAAIRFDRRANRLEITGPVTLLDGTGNVLLAEAAQLSADLREGLMQSARMVLDERLQIAARGLSRQAGRYTVLQDTVASSCKVCRLDPRPLWEIRASRVIHDQQERQLWFENARLEMGGVPVFWLPRLRMPDPTLDRAAGFLMPELRTTSQLGTGLKLPYFLPLGPHRDLTLTPYLTTKNARTLELRYRQAFATGDLDLTGALTRDRALDGETRGYGILTGAFAMPRDFRLTFDLRTVSDPAYLLDYGISDEDRIVSRIELGRTRRNEHVSGRLTHVNSIREGERNATLPSLVADVTWARRFTGGPFGGEAGFRLQSHSRWRSSENPLDGPDADSIADGRDTGRLTLELDWRRSFIFGPGLLVSGLTQLSLDSYGIEQDAVWQGSHQRAALAGGIELRWPLVASDASGGRQVISPVVQLAAARVVGDELPNEDSTLVEFDEGNLFSLDRFAGADMREDGARLNVGLGWTRYDAAGGSVSLMAGRVFRDAAQPFPDASGLAGESSDWLVAARLQGANGLAFTHRLVFDTGNGVDLTKAEARLDTQAQRYGLSASWLWMKADAAENRPNPTRELYLDGRYDLGGAWALRAEGRHDFETQRTSRAGLGLTFRNECLAVDLSLSRRFTSSTSVEPTTDFGLSVDLLGFGGAGKAGPARTCSR